MAIIDENFLCSCGGVLAPLAEKYPDGLIRYACSTCGRTGPVECPLCHKPRTLWLEYGKKCLLCSQGKKRLTRLFKMIIDTVREEEVNI